MKKLINFIIGCLILFCLAYIILLLYAQFSPKLSISGANTFYLYDQNNTLFSGSGEDLTLDDISPYLINATLAIEDKNFYNHQGFDFLRILKSLYI